MMQIHIQRGQESLGTFSLEETTQYITEGSLLESDLAWHEGLEEWMPLGHVCTQLTTQPEALGQTAIETSAEAPASFGQGRYRCQQLLGQGGMGQVWLAYDEQLERPVALKVLHQRSAADIEALRGLKEEVQKCLELTHPNIIRTYDLSEPPGEDAFISMEYVSGEDLYEKLKQHPEGRFSWKEIEPYALSLCDALEYAHDQGMVHRDLKPQNLMVTQENEMKLADFGIAAPATGDGDEAVPRAGTPVYWGPQQAQGMTPAPTDDIYSLGITLYHLLVGEAPFLGTNEPEITRQHIEDEPMHPQKKLEALGGKGKIPGYVSDLILKCLAKKPTERFRGAGEVRAWIKAKGDPAVKKQKRMALVSGVMGVVALAMGALAIWAWTQRTEAVKQKGIAETKQQQAEEAQKAEAEQRMKAVKAKDDEAKQRKEAETQKGRAETELKKAEEVTAWAVGIFKGIKQGELDNATKEQKALLEKALKQSAERIKDLKDKPKVEAKIRLILGEAYHAINEDKQALEHHERALALFLKSPDPNDEGEVVRCYTNIGAVRIKKAEYDKALECFQKALAIQLKHLGPDHPHVAISYTNIGEVYRAKGESDKALEYQKKAMAIGPKQNGPENPVLVASKYNNLAAVHVEKREYDQALELMKKSAAIFHKHLGPNHPNVAICYNNIGAVYDHKGEPDKALEYYHKALKIDLKQLGPDHTGVAFRYRNIGMIHFNKGEYRQALEYQEKALTIRLKRRGPDHPDTVESRSDVGLVKSMIKSNPKPLPEKK